MAKKDAKEKDKSSCECGTCSWISWVFPILLLAIALVPTWLASTWGKWTIIIIAALYIIKKVKPCKKCMVA